jgi:PRTRC genetic system protein C
MARVFVYDGREYPDPSPKLSVDEVRRQLAEFFPELTNAEVRESKRGPDSLFTFARRIGTKGAAGGYTLDPAEHRRVIAAIRRTPAKRLAVFDLARSCLDANGEIDETQLAERQPDLDLASAEADAYAKATRRATFALRGIRRA